jgi:preprotein translocase subunit SecE
LTCLAIWVVSAIGCWRFSVFFAGMLGESRWAWVETAAPLALFLSIAWFAFRLVNWPRFADFLIAVEAEMAKVSWPSRTELVRASIVVIFTIFFLAVILFLFDIVWQFLFKTLGVTA